jgi:four helix bundle protein
VLSFQRLDVYQRSIEFAVLAVDIAATLPRGHAGLSDQLRRAAFSVTLNIAEGAGRASRPDAARHFAIARGSAMECAAVLDIAKVMGVLEMKPYERGVMLLEGVVAMLTKLCR